MHRYRDAAAIVGDFNPTVRHHSDVHLGGVSGHCLIDGVVHHLPNQMMQSAFPGGTDIHAGPLPNRFQALEDLDGIGTVVVG